MHSTPPGRGEFAALLANLQRDTPGLSYQKLADAAGVHRSQVWRWVNAGSTPGYEHVRHLAAWITEQYPHLADVAARLLPAAGYGDPDEPTLPGVPPAAADPLTVRIGQAGRQAIDARYAELAGDIAREIERRRKEGKPEHRIFTDTYEQAMWAIPLMPEADRILRIAALRSFRPPAAPPNDNDNPEPIGLAG